MNRLRPALRFAAALALAGSALSSGPGPASAFRPVRPARRSSTSRSSRPRSSSRTERPSSGGSSSRSTTAGRPPPARSWSRASRSRSRSRSPPSRRAARPCRSSSPTPSAAVQGDVRPQSGRADGVAEGHDRAAAQMDGLPPAALPHRHRLHRPPVAGGQEPPRLSRLRHRILQGHGGLSRGGQIPLEHRGLLGAPELHPHPAGGQGPRAPRPAPLRPGRALGLYLQLSDGFGAEELVRAVANPASSAGPTAFPSGRR